MFGFSLQKKKSNTRLVISVEKSQIRACFVSVDEYEKPYILTQEVQEFQTSGSVAELYKTIHKILFKITKKHPTTVSSIHCVLSSAWSVSKIETYLRDEEVVFSLYEKDLNKILSDFVDTTKESLENNNQNLFDKFQILEQNIIHLSINGYSVEEIFKRDVRRLEAVLYASFVSTSLLENIKEEIERHIRGVVTFSTATLAEFVVVRDIFENIEQFTLISVDEQQTNVSFIDDGVLRSTTNFLLGNSIFKTRVEYANKHYPSMLSGLTMLQKGTSHENIDPDLKNILTLTERDWRDRFLGFFQGKTIPNTVILVSSQENSSFWLKRAIESPQNKHLSLTGTNLHAILITTELLDSFVGSKTERPDLKLMIYASFTTLRNK